MSRERYDCLSERLKKLEARIGSPRYVDFGDVYQAALKKLCRSDRELVAEVMAHGADSRNEPHQTAWARLDHALVEAAAELNAPFFLTANEMMF